MEELKNAKKLTVLTPVEGKDGKTYWRHLGRAYVNRDSSLNLYLDAVPVNGKLQVREEKDSDSRGRRHEQLPITNLPDKATMPPAGEELPF